MLWVSQAAAPVPSVPDRVHAVAGSCVVIPCSYTPLGSKERVDVRLRVRKRYLHPFHTTAFNSESRNQVSRDFQGRTSLYGRMADGDCSVKMEPVHLDDPRWLEIELKSDHDVRWGKAKSFILDVSETPEPPVISGVGVATEGQVVTLNCTASSFCPSTLPTLQWHLERGVLANSSEQAEGEFVSPHTQMPMVLSSVSFTASYHVKPRIRCEASYPGGKKVSASKDFHFRFAPKEVKVQVQTLTVQEGASALLVCSCKADPPVSEYHWFYTQHGRTVTLHQRTHSVRVYNVSRDMRVRCSAQNSVGRGQSHTTALNIQYKPVILHPASACVIERSELSCRCSVDSNPRPSVTWSVNGSEPAQSYNISVRSDLGMVMTALLQGQMDRPLTVICFAVNALGNDSFILLQGEEVTSLLWLVIPAVAFSLIILLLSNLLLLYCCRKKAEKRVLSRPPAVYHGEMAIYQDQMPLYINCTEVTHIYTNGSYQLVYQNCTPLFVHTKQTHPISRRGGERRVRDKKRGNRSGGERRAGVGARAPREMQNTSGSEPEAAIYLEIL
ncbi:B-cell receptor CD22 [Lampris incognitus]|uniref:B-cell receptor CD22 n=1 Tax=Lampris incognitus TaxID=2546036 RepID=UPI0024B4AB56|nr:B-cell receptor CD22 [Lampris incognitus]